MQQPEARCIHSLHIDAVSIPDSSGLIGMSTCPGTQESGMAADLDLIGAWGATAVVTLLEMHELDQLGITHLPGETRSRGMQWHHLPIGDMRVPDYRFRLLWPLLSEHLAEIVMRNGKVLIHCRSGLGRSGMVAALFLQKLKIAPMDAVKRVREARPGTIETRSQLQFVLGGGL